MAGGAGTNRALRGSQESLTLPSLAALASWIYVYSSAGRVPIELSVAWVAAGVMAFLVWARVTRVWPFGPKQFGEAGAAAQP